MAAVLGVLALVGCRGEDISFDCENQRARFNERAEEELVPLLEEIPSKGPYPVAVQITTDGLNELLATVIDEDVPFSGTVPFGLLLDGPADAKFEPASAPQILLRDTPGCDNCVVFHLDFGVQLATPERPVSSGVGFVDLQIPLRVDADPAAGTSTLVAEYGNARIARDGEACSFDDPYACSFYLLVFGLDSTEHTMIAGALKRFMEEEIAAAYTDVELLKIGGWEIGDGQVELLAQDVEINVDHGKIVLGMQTNMPLGGIGLDTSQPLPEGAVMALSMDPRIMLPMAHRMLEEGNIARTYDAEGNPDRAGIYGVTLENLVADPGGAERFDTTFRVWRTAEGYCGYAEAVMPLTMTSMAPALGISFMAGKAEVVKGEGVGAAALDEEGLVDDNQHLIDRFRADLAQQLEDTVNFSAIELTDATIVFSSQGTDLGPAELVTYLDFVVLENE